MSILQNKRFRVGVGVAAVVLAVAAIGAGTYAAFVDTETGPGGTVAAGTLDLTVAGGGANLELIKVSNIQPGFSQNATITLRNVGTLPGGLTSTLQVTGADGVCTEPESEAEGKPVGTCSATGDLQNQLQVAVVRGPSTTTPVPVSQFVGTGLPAPASIPAGATVEYELQFTLPNLAGVENNKVQGDSMTLTSNFVLTQS